MGTPTMSTFTISAAKDQACCHVSKSKRSTVVCYGPDVAWSLVSITNWGYSVQGSKFIMTE